MNRISKFTNMPIIAVLFSVTTALLISVKAFSTNVHVLSIHLDKALSRGIPSAVETTLRDRVLDMAGQWTKISATSANELEEKIKELDSSGIRPTHLIILSHGGSRADQFSLFIENKEIVFKVKTSAKSNPFSAFKGRLANNTKVYLTGCSVFSGSHAEAEHKAALFAQVLGITNGEIFASHGDHYPGINLSPPITTADFPRQLTLHFARAFVLAIPIAATLKIAATYKDFPGYFPSFPDLTIGTALLASVTTALGSSMTPYVHGIQHEGYVVDIKKGGSQARLIATDTYFYRDFVTSEDFLDE